MIIEEAIGLVVREVGCAELFSELAQWKNKRDLTPVELALVQVAFTSIYRDRTGYVFEHLEAIKRLRTELQLWMAGFDSRGMANWLPRDPGFQVTVTSPLRILRDDPPADDGLSAKEE